MSTKMIQNTVIDETVRRKGMMINKISLNLPERTSKIFRHFGIAPQAFFIPHIRYCSNLRDMINRDVEHTLNVLL